MNLPTKITLGRIIAIPVIVALFYVNFPYHYVVAAGVYALAATSDFLDGWLARKRNEITVLGKLLDPIADKVLACTLLIMLSANGDAMMMYNPPVGVICTSLIVGREVLIGALRMVAAHKGVILAADKFGKIKTALINASIPIMLIAEFHLSIKIIGNVLFVAGFIFAMISGINYLVKNRSLLCERKEEREDA